MIDIKDHNILIQKLNLLKKDFKEFSFGDVKTSESIGKFRADRKNNRIVLAEETALELGSPSTLSTAFSLWTMDKNLIKNRLFIYGNLEEIKKSHSFFYCVAMEVEKPPDPIVSKQSDLMYMINTINGIMARRLPGKLWIRIDIERSTVFSFYSFGQFVREEYLRLYPEIKNIDIYIGINNNDLFNLFSELQLSATVISGENRKLTWENEGIVCTDTDCDNCDEKNVCDIVRKVIDYRRDK